MSFWDTLSGVAQNVGQTALQNQPLYKAYQSYQSSRKKQDDPSQPQPQLTDTGEEVIQSANKAAGLTDLSTPGAGQDATMQSMIPDAASMAVMSPWNQNLAGGKLITSPVVARLGESGPEAVVPLTPRPGNKLQPDLLEGHVGAPRVPGVQYSRYRRFNRFARGGV